MIAVVFEPSLIGTVLIALFTTLPPTILAFGTLIQSIRNGAKVEIQGAKIDANAVRAEATSHKTEEIHKLTNGNLANVTGELIRAQQELIVLRGLLAKVVPKLPEEKQTISLPIPIKIVEENK